MKMGFGPPHSKRNSGSDSQQWLLRCQLVCCALLAGLVLLKLTDDGSSSSEAIAPSFEAHGYSDAADMLHAFKRWQSHTLRTLKRAPAPQQPGQLPRVLLVKLPNGGWGNRVPGLITAVLMAAFTDRLLMLAPNPSFTQHLRLAVGEEWDEVAALYAGAPRCSVDRWQLPRQDLQWCNPAAVTIWEYESWDYDVPLLQVNHALGPTLRRWYPHGDVFHGVASFLLHPSASVKAAIAPYAHMADSCLVGVHMRTSKPYPREGRDAPPAFPLQQFASVVRGIAQQAPGSVFLAADADVFSGVAELLPSRHVWWSTTTQSTVGANEATGGNPGTDLSAVVDLLLLARCKHLLITSGSSFGFVAAGMGNIKPTAIAPYKHDHPYDEPWFWASVTSEPCFYAAGKAGQAKMPAEVVATLKETHPLYLYFHQCHP